MMTIPTVEPLAELNKPRLRTNNRMNPITSAFHHAVEHAMHAGGGWFVWDPGPTSARYYASAMNGWQGWRIGTTNDAAGRTVVIVEGNQEGAAA